MNPNNLVPEKGNNPFDKKTREPVYVNEGEEFGDSIGSTKRPKWQIANTSFQKNLLSAVGRTYYQTHNERSAVVAIEKSAMSLSGGLISVYPFEWVEQCIEWAKSKRRLRELVGFVGLINLINNNDRKTQFVDKWSKEHPEVSLHKAGEEPVEEEPTDFTKFER